MEILVASTPPRLPSFTHITKKSFKPTKSPQILNCSRNVGESNSLSGAPVLRESRSSSYVKVHQDDLKAICTEKEEKHNDILQLFNEAQKNILHLNKQRLLAMEELERIKKERDSMLDRLELLEMNTTVKRDKLTMSSEVLLRIDSLVLNGIIGHTEASGLRRLVMSSRGSLADDLYDIICKNDADFFAELRHFSTRSQQICFHIIHICTEMSPVVSVGPLASYITGLSCALQRKGNLVEVILPKYACSKLDEVQGLKEIDVELYSYFNGQLHGNKIWTGVVHGIGVTFIEPVSYASLFSHDKVYGYSNDFERFTYFSRASLDYLVKSGKRPDVLHIHNWQTSIVGPLFWDVFVNQGFEGTKILLTCQGFESQASTSFYCLEQPGKLALCGLDPSRLFRSDRLQDNNKSHLVNILKGGVVYSNKVILMSSGQTKGQIINSSGDGLEQTFGIHREKLVIAPSGLDKSTWDPSRDNLIPQSYNADEMKGKFVCKAMLQRRLGLHEGTSKVLVGSICSDVLDVDLEKLKPLVWMMSRRGVQFVFMGSSQLPVIRRALKLFQEEVRDENVRFIDEYDEELSRLILSGCDIMLCPCFDDPVLQVPLKAMKYGAAPVPINYADSRFRNFGDDSVEGTKFSQYIKYTFANMSLGQAIDEIEHNPSQWITRICDAMKKDFSWDSECADVHISAYTAVRDL
ncbi:UDP-Glycosyltransferase superfamily protein [Striga hermonthica]|uniref:starch synthase n=1 Tax=Striga hermonthica TaxID=68872 RepID=A0A9N7MS37_STRHE|nr:UDP-Glycosyltransferase superfamily protein [Striga hermonthica]